MDKKFSKFVYELENVVDELVIALLSVSAIIVSVYTIFFNSQSVDFIEFGRIIQPWIVMLGLMIIGRELWLINNSLDRYLESEGEN
jgi:hypothetical protein